MTAAQWVLWALQRKDGSGMEVAQGTKAEMQEAAERRTASAARVGLTTVAYVPLPRGQMLSGDDIPPLEPAAPKARTLDGVTADLVRVACAGTTAATRDATAAKVRALTEEACRLAREDERQKARRSLAAAWSAWLSLMLTVRQPEAGGKTLLQDVLDLEPELRARFEEAFFPARVRLSSGTTGSAVDIREGLRG